MAFSLKLQGTDSHTYVGYIGRTRKMCVAGTQEKVTNLLDFSSPASSLTAVLSMACSSFGVRPAAQQISIGAPAAASDEMMKRCQGSMLEETQPDEWRQWQCSGRSSGRATTVMTMVTKCTCLCQ